MGGPGDEGAANLFMAFEPLAGQRHVEVTERKAVTAFARFFRPVCDDPTVQVL